MAAFGSQEHFYERIGEGITRWANVERAMLVLFHNCVPNLSSEQAVAIFYTAQTVNAKCELVRNALVASNVRDDLRKRWAALGEVARKAAEQRNKLAHWTILGSFQGDIRLRQPNTAKRKGDSVGVAEIAAMCKQFDDCAKAVKALGRSVRETHRAG